MAKTLTELFAPEKSNTTFSEGKKSKGLIDDAPEVKSITTKDIRMGNCIISSDGTTLTIKSDQEHGNTTLFSLDLATGNLTLGGTQKRVICSKFVGV